MSATNSQSIDEAFADWQKRTFHNNQSEGAVLLEREVWRAACAYQQGVDVKAVEDVIREWEASASPLTFGPFWLDKLKRRITGEK